MIAAAFVVVFYPAMVTGLSLGLLIGALALGGTPSTVVAEGVPARASGQDTLVSGAFVEAPPTFARATSTADKLAAESDLTPETAHLQTHRSPSDVVSERDDPPPATSVRVVPTSRHSRAAVESMSRSAAVRHGLDADWFAQVIFCESSFRANAVGLAGEIGAAQWKLSTWNSNAPRLGYLPADIHDPAKNIELAAFVISRDGGWRWTCAKVVS